MSPAARVHAMQKPGPISGPAPGPSSNLISVSYRATPKANKKRRYWGTSSPTASPRKRGQNFPEIRARHRTATAPSWTGPASKRALYILEISISTDEKNEDKKRGQRFVNEDLQIKIYRQRFADEVLHRRSFA